MNSTLVAASVSRSTANVLGWIARLMTGLSVVDWILVGVAVLLVMWGWVRAAAFARLGTIAVEDVGADGDTLTPVAIRAELQQALGDRGLLPPSGVPSGSPTNADLSNAVASSGAPQAAWIAGLINLIPVPATRTSFTLTATIVTDDTQPNEKVGLLYELACTGPAPNVTLAGARGPTWPAVIDQVGKDAYRQIAQDAPAIYPQWARWKSTAALTKFGEGLKVERGIPTAGQPVPAEPGNARLDAAAGCYLAASQEDPDNMLARLRLANCLERKAGLAEGQVRVDMLVRALQAYTSIRLRQPDIFEAGYRASVLLSSVAQAKWDATGHTRTKVEDIVRRLETDKIRTIGGRSVTGTASNATGPRSDEQLRAAAQRAARRESRLARHRLWAPYTILLEGRFRHRFEPTGRDRRYLRKALRVSKLCIEARKARTMKTSKLNPLQLLWRARRLSMLGFRPYDAGWQADYNSASFYALVLEALTDREPTFWIRTQRIRRLAMRHLRRAIDQAGPELQCRYVRDEDPDLNALRKLDDFSRALGRLCPDELIVHVSRNVGEAGWSPQVWTLHVWDGAQETTWDKPLCPFSVSPEELKFRVRIRDENEPVRLILHAGNEKAEPEQRSIPALPRGPEAWLYLSSDVAFRTEPADWPLQDRSAAPAVPG